MEFVILVWESATSNTSSLFLLVPRVPIGNRNGDTALLGLKDFYFVPCLATDTGTVQYASNFYASKLEFHTPLNEK